MARICQVEDCNRPHKGRGWCSTHYNQWLQHGDPLHEAEPRMCSKVGCRGAPRTRNSLQHSRFKFLVIMHVQSCIFPQWRLDGAHGEASISAGIGLSSPPTQLSQRAPLAHAERGTADLSR